MCVGVERGEGGHFFYVCGGGGGSLFYACGDGVGWGGVEADLSVDLSCE